MNHKFGKSILDPIWIDLHVSRSAGLDKFCRKNGVPIYGPKRFLVAIETRTLFYYFILPHMSLLIKVARNRPHPMAPYLG